MSESLISHQPVDMTVSVVATGPFVGAGVAMPQTRIDEAFDYSSPYSARGPDLRLDRYADYSQRWLWTVDGLPVDFTGASAVMTLRQSETAPVLLSISSVPSPSGSIVLGGSTGLFQINVTHVATGAISVTQCLYDLLFDWSDGSTTDALSGRVAIYPSMTH